MSWNINVYEDVEDVEPEVLRGYITVTRNDTVEDVQTRIISQVVSHNLGRELTTDIKMIGIRRIPKGYRSGIDGEVVFDDPTKLFTEVIKENEQVSGVLDFPDKWFDVIIRVLNSGVARAAGGKRRSTRRRSKSKTRNTLTRRPSRRGRTRRRQ